MFFEFPEGYFSAVAQAISDCLYDWGTNSACSVRLDSSTPRRRHRYSSDDIVIGKNLPQKVNRANSF